MSVTDQIRDKLPIHYASCAVVSDDTWPCDCTATADITALLELVDKQAQEIENQAKVLADVSETLDKLAGPDDEDGG